MCQRTLWIKATPLCRLNPECWHHRQAQDLRLLRRHLLQPYQMPKCQIDCSLLLNGTTASITQDLQDESVDQRDLEKLFVSKRTHCVFPMTRKTIISQAWIPLRTGKKSHTTTESCKAVKNRLILAVLSLRCQYLRSKNRWTMVHCWNKLRRLAVLAAVKLRHLFFLHRMPKNLRMKKVR